MTNTDNPTEMLSLVQETEAGTLTSACTESCWTSQEEESCEELCTGEGLEAHVHWCSETVILLPGVCNLQIRKDKKLKITDLEAKGANAKVIGHVEGNEVKTNKCRLLVVYFGYWAALTVLPLCHHVTSFPYNTTYTLSGARMSSWESHWRKEPSPERSPGSPGLQRENHEWTLVTCWGNPSRAGHSPSYLWFPWGGHCMPDFHPGPQINRTIKGRLNHELTWWSVQVHSRDTGHYKGFSNSAREQHKNQ